MANELLFSVTASDCDWEYMRGTGPGGQKRNKTESKVRCTHRLSGAIGESDETRSQHENKRKAFVKMANSATFKKWHRIEVARKMGALTEIAEKVDRMMNNVKVEVKVDGKWTNIVEIPKD